MDATSAALLDYCASMDSSALAQSTVHECKRRVIDTVASALFGYDEPISSAARRVAQRYRSSEHGASVWGCSWTTSPEAAAFANGTMVRFLDLSDMYAGRGAGHPSDVIAGIVALAQSIGASGSDTIGAITIAYDVYCSFCDAIDISAKGWDQPVPVVIASAVAMAKLARLSREQSAHALALAVAPNMALYQTRRGELSSWKGAAGANGARNALFAVALASEGFTGPSAVFDGKNGLREIVGDFEWKMPSMDGTPRAIERTHMKTFPICYHGQSAAWAALALRPRIDLKEIAGIEVLTHAAAIDRMANDPARWAPRSHETADHSLPYVVSMALLDGSLSAKSFAQERLDDPRMAELMKKVSVRESAAYCANYPRLSECRLTIRKTDGTSEAFEVDLPKGHIGNPLTDAELEGKYRDAFTSYGDASQCGKSLAAFWKLEEADKLSLVFDTLVKG